MALGYLLGGGVIREPQGVELYREYRVMRDLYEQVAGWCELPVSMLLSDEIPQDPEVQQAIGSVRQAALATAVHDILAEQGVHPSLIGGLSLGGMTGAALAGAVPREQLFSLMAAGVRFPPWPASEPAQGMAVVSVPDGESFEEYVRGHPRLHMGVWIGPGADGTRTHVVVGGRARDLAALAAAHPAGVVTVLPGVQLAIHTPLRERFRSLIAPFLERVDFRDPLIPLFGALENKQLTTAADVRHMFDRNPVEPVYLPHIHDAMLQAGTELAVVVSASIPPGLLRIPFPVVHVDGPRDIEKVLSSIYELDVRYPERGVAA